MPAYYPIVVVGGGAAGFFAAIRAGELLAEEGHQGRSVLLLERGSQFLSKVRISGGGRCNVTHSCFDARRLASHYPRGERALIGPFSRFQPRHTIEWYESRGVRLKTEADGRMFPTTDSSQTIIDCLTHAADNAGVELLTQTGLSRVEQPPEGGFQLTLSNGNAIRCQRLLLATGGHKGGEHPAVTLGHTLEPAVPSLFTFNIEVPWLRDLAGLSVEPVAASIPGTPLAEQGPFLATHWGASGPVILRLSAWGARLLYEQDYRFTLRVNWLPGMSEEALLAELRSRRQPTLVSKSPVRPLPQRLWEQLIREAGIAEDQRWSNLSRPALLQLVKQLRATEFPVTGKSTNKSEFVTCGGVRLNEVHFRTMESRITPGLYFAGELLDIDGITGGFNFQAAWTTGWTAGTAMAEAIAASEPNPSYEA